MVDTILGYYVFAPAKGGWLQCDETTWSQDFYGTQSFESADLANAIGERECEEGGFYVLACLGSI